MPCPGGSLGGKGGVKGERKRLINSILFAERNARITKSQADLRASLARKGNRGVC